MHTNKNKTISFITAADGEMQHVKLIFELLAGESSRDYENYWVANVIDGKKMAAGLVKSMKRSGWKLARRRVSEVRLVIDNQTIISINAPHRRLDKSNLSPPPPRRRAYPSGFSELKRQTKLMLDKTA